MIFRPGFSTAEKVTDVSGRGVGMDVVKTNIERIGGTITLENRPGQGTTVRITIPLTLAIIPALIVTVGDDRFAIPQVSLIEVLNLSGEAAGEAVEWIHETPICRLRGGLLPLVYLRQSLALEEDRSAPATATNIVVLQVEGCRFGLVVDHVINTEEIVVKPLSRLLKSIPVFAGATIMGDGAVVLDPGRRRPRPDSGTDRHEVGGHASSRGSRRHRKMHRQPFLLCESGDRRRVAIRLRDVQRLEEFAPDQVRAHGLDRGGAVQRPDHATGAAVKPLGLVAHGEPGN